MHLNISELLFYKAKPQKTLTNPEKYKLYNLLFNGRISMKEYLKGVEKLKHETQKVN